MNAFPMTQIITLSPTQDLHYLSKYIKISDSSLLLLKQPFIWCLPYQQMTWKQSHPSSLRSSSMPCWCILNGMSDVPFLAVCL